MSLRGVFSFIAAAILLALGCPDACGQQYVIVGPDSKDGAYLTSSFYWNGGEISGYCETAASSPFVSPRTLTSFKENYADMAVVCRI